MFESRWVRHFLRNMATFHYTILHKGNYSRIYMRSTAFALTILLISCSFVGCASEDESEGFVDPISDIDREDIREETNEPTSITSQDCEERGGIWIEEREECSFDSDRSEEETGPSSVPP